MISFTNKKLYAKGTCNVVCADPVTGDIYYQSDKFNTGSINASANMNEIRAGLGNPIAAMIPSDSALEVDFEAADFNLWVKAAQVGATLSYNAPVPTCQTVQASSTVLSIDVTGGTPVPQLGTSVITCQVQEVGAASLVGTDGTAYKLNPTTGEIEGFTATSGKTYKVWYFVEKASAQVAKLATMFDPKVVHFTAQIAVYANESGSRTEGTRVGWLYVIVPRLKMNGNATITGDQGNNDTSNISGQAAAYDSEVVSENCSDCDTSTLGFYVYAPDDSASDIVGLTVFGGVTSVSKSSSAQLPVRFVMADGSTVKPSSYAEGFRYTLTGAPSGTSITGSGVITTGTTTGDCDCKVTYEDGTATYEVHSTVSVTA